MFWGGAFLLELIEGFFVGVIALGQFAFVEVVGGIAVAELRVVEDVFFRLFLRVPDRILFCLFAFACCHVPVFVYFTKVVPEVGKAFASTKLWH